MNTNDLPQSSPISSAPIKTPAGATRPAEHLEQPQSSVPTRLYRTLTLAVLAVLGITPWAHAQLAPPDYPAYCPPLTAFASPTLFDVFFGTNPIRFPYQ